MPPMTHGDTEHVRAPEYETLLWPPSRSSWFSSQTIVTGTGAGSSESGTHDDLDACDPDVGFKIGLTGCTSTKGWLSNGSGDRLGIGIVSESLASVVATCSSSTTSLFAFSGSSSGSHTISVCTGARSESCIDGLVVACGVGVGGSELVGSAYGPSVIRLPFDEPSVGLGGEGGGYRESLTLIANSPSSKYFISFLVSVKTRI